jgi:hypothetical protein
MPRRRKRTINWGPVLVLATLINLVAGALYSPLTSPRILRVEGVPTEDQNRVKSILSRAEGIAYKSVPTRELESDILNNPAVKTVQLSHNLFGRARLKAEYRQPVAKIVGPAKLYFDIEGVLFRTEQNYPNLRSVDVEPSMIAPNLSLSLSWPAAQIADFVTKLNNIDAVDGKTLYLDARGRLWLNGGGPGRVDLGGTDALNEKLSQLNSLLVERPNLLKEVKSLSLTDPRRPAIIPLSR